MNGAGLIVLLGLLVALAAAWRAANNRWGWIRGQVRRHLNRQPLELDDADRPARGERPDERN